MSNRTLQALLDLLKTPGASVGLGTSAVMLALGAVATGWFVLNARSSECEIASHEPLSIDELIAVKKRFKAYKRNPQAGLALSGEELSMLLEDRADVPVYVDIDGQHLHAQIALPSDDGSCWPIDFEGDLTIEEGVAFVIPEKLTLGSVDLSALASGLRMELLPEHMPTAKTALFLEQTRTAVVHEGQVRVELLSPSEFSLNR